MQGHIVEVVDLKHFAFDFGNIVPFADCNLLALEWEDPDRLVPNSAVFDSPQYYSDWGETDQWGEPAGLPSFVVEIELIVCLQHQKVLDQGLAASV